MPPSRVGIAQDDSRYMVLACRADERDEIMRDYLLELEDRAKEEQAKRHSINPNATLPSNLAAPSGGAD